MAELFAGSLKDYGGAVLIGELTSRCGAGWHRGDSPDWLEHVGLELHIPDYVAYRRDGSSYRNGVEPDIATGWEDGGDDKQRAERLVAALRRLFGPEFAAGAKR
jgi:C-terminal processing protease CtpA/Prc